MNEAPYPWQSEAWRRLQRARTDGRLAHALLINGLDGLGKSEFAERFAHSLLCETPDENHIPCGVCRGCTFLAGGTHPDFRRMEPEGEGKPIKVDAVREFAAWSVMTSQEGGPLVTLVEPADALNPAAANALLKTLEEPVAGNQILLVSSRPAALPATIRSRCQAVTLSPPSSQEAEDWLESRRPGEPWSRLVRLANGAPLRALELAEGGSLAERDRSFEGFEALCRGKADVPMIAESWVGETYEQNLGWLSSWIGDLVRLGLGAEVRQLRNPDFAPAMQPLAMTVDLRAMMRIQERATSLALAGRRDNLNPQLQLEELLLELVGTLK